MVRIGKVIDMPTIETTAKNLRAGYVIVTPTGKRITIERVSVTEGAVRYISATGGQGLMSPDTVVRIEVPHVEGEDNDAPVFTLSIRTGGDAFKDTTGTPHREIIQCLYHVIDQLLTDAIDPTGKTYSILDDNGNRAGSWKLVSE